MSRSHDALIDQQEEPMALTGFGSSASVFSTQAVDQVSPSLPERRADMAAELLRCAEMCRLAAGVLAAGDQRVVEARAAEAAPQRSVGRPLWSVDPVVRAF